VRGVVGAILIPFDSAFESHQGSIPVSIQRKPGDVDRSDIFQKWENGSEFLFLDVPDDVAELIALLKDRDMESDRTVHVYFPNGIENDQQTSNHIIVDASGFGGKFSEFEKGCASDQ
jgi:hypothetical protein